MAKEIDVSISVKEKEWTCSVCGQKFVSVSIPFEFDLSEMEDDSKNPPYENRKYPVCIYCWMKALGIKPNKKEKT